MADNPPRPSASSFGQNIWVVDEVYQRYLESPESVSPAWQEFFPDYQPASAIPAPPAVAPALPASA